MCGLSGSWPRPFAVGLLALQNPMDAAGRTTARLDLALHAYKCGYFLIDTIETNAAGTGYLAAELLVSRTDADAVITHGPVDDDWLHSVADRHRLMIRRTRR